MDLKTTRLARRISQSELSRLAKVPRSRIWAFEMGVGGLSPEEQERIRIALRDESARLKSIPDEINFESAMSA